MTQKGARALSRKDFIRGMALGGAALPFLGSMPGCGGGKAPTDPLTSFPYVDGLTFLTDDPSDVRSSGLSSFILDVSQWEPVESPDGAIRYFRSFEASVRSLTAMRRDLMAGELAGPMFLATRGSEISRAHEEGRCAIFLQFQGCEPVGEDLTRLDLFYELGLRVLQLTHHNDNALAGGAIEPVQSGLTPLGAEAVERMEELGLLPDLSHGSDATCRDVLEVSRRPVVISHGAARTLVDHPRCTPDDIIRGVADSGGVLGVFMMSFWLTTEPEPRVEHLIRQLRHVRNVGGVESVAIANDYSVAGQLELAALGNDNRAGVQSYHPWWASMANRGVWGFDTLPEHVVIPELNNVERMFTIHRALEEASFPAREVELIMGGNWIRVLTESLG